MAEALQCAEALKESDNGDQAADETQDNDLVSNEKDLDKGTTETSLKGPRTENNDGNHSDPETGEVNEALLLSVKEAVMDVSVGVQPAVDDGIDGAWEVLLGQLSVIKRITYLDQNQKTFYSGSPTISCAVWFHILTL